MTPSRLQAPPRPSPAMQTTWTAPLSSSILFSFLWAKKASDRPSGDQNGFSASSVPATGRESSSSRRRIQICIRPSFEPTRVTYPIKVLTPRGVCLPQMKRGSADLFFREFVPRQRNSRRKVDDPRRENTGTPSSGAVSGCGAWQRQPGLSGVGDLAVAVLPLEEEVRSIRSGRLAPAPAGVPARAPAQGGSPRGASCSGHGSVLADVGSSTALGPASAKLDTGGTEHDPSTPSTHRAWKWHERLAVLEHHSARSAGLLTD